MADNTPPATSTVGPPGPSRTPSSWPSSTSSSRPASPPSIDAADVLARSNPSTSRRLLVVLCFPLLFLLAVPFWYHTTSIERLPLPSDRIAALASAPFPTVTSHILFTAEDAVFPSSPPGKAVFPTRTKVDALAAEVVKGIDGVELRKRPADRGRRSWEFVYDDDPRRPAPLRLHLQVDETAKTAFPLEPYIVSPTAISSVPAGTLVIPVHPSLISDRNLKQHYKIAISRALLDLSPHYEHNVPLRALAYAPNVTLSFVLLNEDAAAGSYVRAWDVERAIDYHIRPHLGPLVHVFNFSIESQILYHAPLSFEPSRTTLQGSTQALLDAAATDADAEAAAQAAVDEAAHGSWVVTEEDAKVFVNSERWSLDSGSTNNPVLRFLLFVPSSAHRPMHLAPSLRAVPSDAFLLPQFGGVVILNPPADAASDVLHLGAPALDAPFALFTRHLYELLDLPFLPDWMVAPEPAPRPSSGAETRVGARRTAIQIQPVTPWQVETVLRTRLRENAGEAAKTLAGIVRLVDKISEMKVGAGVQALVDSAVQRLEGLPIAARSNSPLAAFLLARDAAVLASRAFFDPSMMGQLYFPDQHKFAVYTPLFAPVGIAMAVALVRELVAALKRRRARAALASQARRDAAHAAHADDDHNDAHGAVARAVAQEWAALEIAATPTKRAGAGANAAARAGGPGEEEKHGPMERDDEESADDEKDDEEDDEEEEEGGALAVLQANEVATAREPDAGRRRSLRRRHVD
ncbi:GPI transamidase component [Cryptotrichosporon argae]